MIERLQRCVYLVGESSVELREVPLSGPGPGEILLRVDVATTCGTDLKVYRSGGHPRMLSAPCPFGHEMTGTVVATGAGSYGWREGDAVVVANSASCGVCRWCLAGRENLCTDLHYINGAFADFLLVPERFARRSTYARPENIEPVVAALAEPLACVVHGVSMCPEDSAGPVVVLGAGPIGLMFMAELAAAGRLVVLADLDRGRLETGLRLGAAHTVVLSGQVEDDLESLAATESGPGLVVEATGTLAGWNTAMSAVGVGGTVILFGGCPPETVAACDSYKLHYSEITVKGVYHHRPATFASALERLADRSEAFSLLINEEYPLSGVETALKRMGERQILKAAIVPGLDR